MSLDAYPAGAFDGPTADVNHDQFEHDNSFSGSGDIQRRTGQDTTAESRRMNALADEAIRETLDYARAGDGTWVDESPEARHVYGT